MILDAFTFFNEFDLLEFRLRLLWERVDKFVIVESDHTFSGKKKPWNFLENKERYAWAMDKIVYHQHEAKDVWDGSNPPKVTDYSHACWGVEYSQRNAIVDAIRYFSDDDTLLISDCDEIPDPVIFDGIQNLMRWEPVALRQKIFYYNLSCLRREPWNGTIVTRVGTARVETPQGLRDQRNYLQSTYGGWHLSYFTDAKGIRDKLGSFSHAEYNTPEYTNENHIEDCISARKDLFGRGVVIDKVGEDFFPGYFLKEANKFNWWPKEDNK